MVSFSTSRIVASFVSPPSYQQWPHLGHRLYSGSNCSSSLSASVGMIRTPRFYFNIPLAAAKDAPARRRDARLVYPEHSASIHLVSISSAGRARVNRGGQRRVLMFPRARAAEDMDTRW